MYSRVKFVQKILKPKTLVDQVFEAQGFRKKGQKYSPYYQLRIDDNCTQSCYELKIPIQEIYLNDYNQNEPFYKLQQMQILKKSPIMKDKKIPNAVVQAANEKINEVISYLGQKSNTSV